MGKKRSLPSTEKQLKALKKKKILSQTGRNLSSGKMVKSPWTIYRLYKFYITDKHHSNEPMFEAYSQRKRTFARIEQKGIESSVATPRGRQSGLKYIQKVDEDSEKRLKRSLPTNVSPRFGKYYKTVQHVRDEFTYRLQPPINATQASMDKANRRVEAAADDIAGILKRFISTRKNLYRNHAVGAIIMYRTRNVETLSGIKNPEGYIRVPWIRLYDVDIFKDALLEGFGTALDIVFKYLGGSVSIRKADIYISTIWKGTNIDMLRARN